MALALGFVKANVPIHLAKVYSTIQAMCPGGRI